MNMVSIHRRKNVNIVRVAIKVVVVLIGLYVSGQILTVIGTVMNGTSSPFYSGLTLIGWTVTAATGQITSTSTGTNTLLGVVGLAALASVILDFVDIRL